MVSLDSWVSSMGLAWKRSTHNRDLKKDTHSSQQGHVNTLRHSAALDPPLPPTPLLQLGGSLLLPKGTGDRHLPGAGFKADISSLFCSAFQNLYLLYFKNAKAVWFFPKPSVLTRPV